LAVFGWVFGIVTSLAAFVFVYFYYQFSENGILIMLIVCVSLLALFLITLINYSVITRRTNRFRVYIVLISGRQKTNLDELSHMSSRSISYIQRDLQKMIEQYYFLFAMINHTTNELVIYMPPLQQVSVEKNKVAQKEKRPYRVQPFIVVMCIFGIIAGLFFAGLKLFPIVSEYLDLNWKSPNIEDLLHTQPDNPQDVQDNSEASYIPETTDLPEAIISPITIPPNAVEYKDGKITWIILKDNRPKAGTIVRNYFNAPQESDGSGTMFIMTKYIYMTYTAYNNGINQYGWSRYEDASCKAVLDKWYKDNVSTDLKVLAKHSAALSSSSEDSAGSDWEGIVFPLSITETNEYIAKGFDSLKVSMDSFDTRCSWWLRSPGNEKADVLIILSDGTLRNWQANHSTFALGFRPAMWIETNLDDYENIDQTNIVLDNSSSDSNDVVKNDESKAEKEH
jgi:hypothetical protein